MAITTSTGLISQIDYQALIEQLVQLKRIPVDELIATKDRLKDIDTAYSTLESRLKDLRSAADELRTSTGFKVFTTDVTDSSILSATASSSATEGVYSIVVSSVAKAHKLIASGVSDSDTTAIASTTGSFSFTVGSSTTYSVSVDTSTTLENLRDAINNLNAGVTATIVNEGSGTNPYRLILTSDSTGTANSITITQNDTDLTFTDLQAAQDASLTVDGLSITRSSNTITDVIDGVTIELKSADSTKTVDLTVSRDIGEIEKKITSFIDKYNAVVSHIRSNNRYDTDTGVAGAFFGDPIARSVMEDLRRTMTSAISGLPDTMNRLIHIGVTTSSDNGTMSIDSAELSDALNNNFDDVVNLFVDGTSTDGFASLVYSLTDDMLDYVDGRITNKIENLNDNISDLEEEIARKENEILLYQEQLRVQFASLERLLAGLRAQGDFLANL